MTQQLSLERRLADLMADEASGGAPDALVDHILAATSAVRPTPRWLAAIQEPPMTANARTAVGVPRRQLVLVAAVGLLAATAIVGAAALLLLRQQPTTDTWPGFRGDAGHNGRGLTGPIGNPAALWQFHAAGAFHGAVAVTGDLVLATSDDGILHAISIDNGTERWHAPGYGATEGPFVDAGHVYIATANDTLSMLDLESGRVLWTSSVVLQAPSDPVVVDGHLYTGTQDGLVVALDASNGNELWRRAVSPASSRAHVPSASSDVVIGVADDGSLVALDPSNGALRWRVDVSDQVPGTPVLGSDAVYMGIGSGPNPGYLGAFDLRTGAERWRTSDALSAPSLAGDFAYSANASGDVEAVELATGSTVWRAQVGGTLRNPVAAGDVVYVSGDSTHVVVALDRATGGRLWTFGVDGGSDCCLAVARGLAVVATTSGTVYAIGGDGAALAPQTAGPQVSTSPSSLAPATLPPLRQAKVDWAVGTGENDFTPWGLARDPQGNLWAAEAEKDRFAIFSADGGFIEYWGTGGSGPGQFHLTRANGDPYGMVAFAPDGSFYVLDPGNRRIDRFDAARKFVRSWGGFGTSPGTFSDPVSMVVNGSGAVSVLDDQRQVIETFDATGTVLKTIPAFPPAATPTAGANQLALGPNGDYYESIVGPNEVIEIDQDGLLVRVYGGGSDRVSPFAEQPNVMAFDATGRLYVTQGPGRRDAPGVVIFDTNGTYLGGFGALGKAEDELGFPWGLVVRDDGILVADAGGLPDVGFSSLIRKFEPIAIP